MSTVTTSDKPTPETLAVNRIEPAYKQVAEQIRRLILDGTLVPGEQLPVEEKLGASFGVSRNTVREALRMLSSQNLVHTTRGVSGGTFVSVPNAEILQGSIETSLQLLSGQNGVNVDELFDTRTILEVPGAHAAALNRTEADLERMRASVERVEHGTNALDRADHSQDFHQAVLDASGNRLLSMITPPIWRVFRKKALISGGVPETWPDIDHDHLLILGHIEAQRPEEAAAAMRQHLIHLHENRM